MKSLIPLLLLTAPVQAGMVSGSEAFHVSTPNPDIVGDGFFVLDANRLVDFEFTIFGRTWTETDVPRCDCQWEFMADPILDFRWDGEDEFWRLTWVFHDGNFALNFLLDGMRFLGTSENGEAFAPITGANLRLPEPGSLVLLLLGLLALPLSRRLT